MLLRPRLGHLNAYKDALERLNTSIAFKTSDRDTRETVRFSDSIA